MVANSPGILPKTALVGSKAIYYPFTIPQKLNDSSTLVGSELNHMVGGINGAIGNAYAALKPRGPAKWLLPLFGKIDQAVQHSDAIAARNKAVFWDPFSQGAESVGRAIASPGTYWYLKKVGIEQPTQDNIKAALNTKLFHFPDAGEVGGAAAAADAPASADPNAGPGSGGAVPPASEGAPAPAATAAIEAAAEGAGQVAA